MLSPLTCPYCGNRAQLVGGDVIYEGRRDLALLKYHHCAPCDARVGSHKPGAHTYQRGVRIVSDGTLPLGRLANSELRRAKMRAHAAFDPTWQEAGLPRRAAYQWLADQLGIHVDDTHIGEFDLAMCRRVVDICSMRERV